MKHLTASIALCVLVVAGLGAPCSGQGNKGLKDAEIKKVVKLLADLRAQPKYPPTDRAAKKKEKVEKAFYDEIEKLKKAYSDPDLLSFVDDWAQVFAQVAGLSKPKSPAGKGRVKEEKVFQKDRGRYIGFEYGLYVPPAYKSSRSWPLILALHDKGSNGPKYLKEVWTDKKKIKKDLYDQFIIVAPTIGDKTIAKSKRREDRKNQKRIEPFTGLHRGGIALCLRDVLERYNIDTDRMFLDGTGLGGETAAWLGVMQSKLWAGVAVRSARVASSGHFSKPQYLTNLRNQCPMVICDRKDGPYSTADGKQDRQQIDHHIQVDKLPITFKEYEALPDRRARQRALGSQESDPIHDASNEIAEFFLKQKRNLYASDLGYITYDNRSFRQTGWYVIDRANASPADGTTASLSGKIDREKNVVEFTSHNVESFRIYVNDHLVDLDKQLKIIVNGKEVLEKKIDRSLDYMLKYNDVNRVDPALVMVGELRIQVPLAEEGGEKPGGGNGSAPKEEADKPVAPGGAKQGK